MFDYIIIGAGPGGLGLAHRLNDGKNKIAIIENDKWGGTCPNYGCDPTKVMMAVLEAKNRVDNLKGQGISGELKIDWEGIRSRKIEITDPYEEKAHVGLKEAGITTIYGSAKFTTDGEVEVAGETYAAKKVIIATGTRARQLPIDGGELLSSSNDFLVLDEMPKNVVFIGTGPIGLELAQLANAAGAKVTVLAVHELAVGHFEKETGDAFLEELKRQGIEFKENISISKVEKTENGLLISDGKGFGMQADLVVAGVGRIPNTDMLNLEAVGVETDRGGILVNEYLQTSNPNIYGLGDIISKPLGHLTPVSAFENRYLARTLGQENPEPIKYPVIPSVIFGTTKLAEVGVLSGEGIKTKSFDMSSWYTYRRINDPVAKMKVATNENQEIVGASTVSSVADEVINLLMILIQQKITLSEFNDMITAYPTVASDLGYFY